MLKQFRLNGLWIETVWIKWVTDYKHIGLNGFFRVGTFSGWNGSDHKRVSDRFASDWKDQDCHGSACYQIHININGLSQIQVEYNRIGSDQTWSHNLRVLNDLSIIGRTNKSVQRVGRRIYTPTRLQHLKNYCCTVHIVKLGNIVTLISRNPFELQCKFGTQYSPSIELRNFPSGNSTANFLNTLFPRYINITKFACSCHSLVHLNKPLPFSLKICCFTWLCASVSVKLWTHTN